MGLARGGVAALLIFGLIGCQSDADYYAQAQTEKARVEANAKVVNLDPDTLMAEVCLIKLQHLETMTPAWTRFCKERGFIGA